MLKKLITGIIIAFAILGGIWGYFLYIGDPSTLRSRIASNRAYTAVFLISIIMITFLQWKNKIFRFLTMIILLVNAFLLGDLFFKNNIGLDSRQFIILFGLVLIGLAIMYISHRIRYILGILVGIAIGGVLLTGILPMYETIPNINDFVSSQTTQIINKWANQGKIIIKNALWTEEINVEDLDIADINLSETTQISFASPNTIDQQKLFIWLGDGSFINLSPQSAITLLQSWQHIDMQIIQGNISYYIPQGISGTIQIVGKYAAKQIQTIQNTTRAQLVKEFDQQKEDFFLKQLWGNIITNPIVNDTIKFFLNTLYTISPKNYQKNINNYNTIQEYLGLINTGTTNNLTGITTKNFIENIMGQIKKWSEETKFFNK